MALRQSGSVVVYILVAVALLAALTFAMTRSSQTGRGALSQHQARALAQETLDYGLLIERAVDRLRRNGCSENELSFEHTGSPGLIVGWLGPTAYVNVDSPPDGSCHVFHQNGGRVPPPQKPKYAHNKAFDFLFPDNYYAVNNPVASDIVMYIRLRDKNVCIEYNRIIGNGLPTTLATLGQNNPCGAAYKGKATPSICQQPHCGAYPVNCNPYRNNIHGCFIFNDMGNVNYVLYYTVLKR